MTLKIALRIADDLERSRFLSLFEIMAPRLADQWEVTDTGDADVVIVDANQPGSKFFLNTCRRSIGALPVVYAHSNEMGSEWYLAKPVRVNSFIPLLNKAGTFVRESRASSRNAKVGRDRSLLMISDKVDALAQDNPLAALIAMVTGEGSARFLSNARLPKLYYDPVARLLYAPAELLDVTRPFTRLQLLNRIDITQVHLVEVSAAMLPSLAERDLLIAVDLDLALWCSALHLSQGRLPRGMSEKELARLKHPPDFHRFPCPPEAREIAELLHAQPISLEGVARKLNLPLPTVVDMFNACRSVDLAKIGIADIISVEERDRPELGGLLKRLFGL